MAHAQSMRMSSPLLTQGIGESKLKKYVFAAVFFGAANTNQV
jgi:hypothetical protein